MILLFIYLVNHDLIANRCKWYNYFQRIYDSANLFLFKIIKVIIIIILIMIITVIIIIIIIIIIIMIIIIIPIHVQVVSAWSAINGVLRAVFNTRMEQNVS